MVESRCWLRAPRTTSDLTFRLVDDWCSTMSDGSILYPYSQANSICRAVFLFWPNHIGAAAGWLIQCPCGSGQSIELHRPVDAGRHIGDGATVAVQANCDVIARTGAKTCWCCNMGMPAPSSRGRRCPPSTTAARDRHGPPAHARRTKKHDGPKWQVPDTWSTCCLFGETRGQDVDLFRNLGFWAKRFGNRRLQLSQRTAHGAMKHFAT